MAARNLGVMKLTGRDGVVVAFLKDIVCFRRNAETVVSSGEPAFPALVFHRIGYVGPQRVGHSLIGSVAYCALDDAAFQREYMIVDLVTLLVHAARLPKMKPERMGRMFQLDDVKP
jgi:hypothetical protein